MTEGDSDSAAMRGVRPLSGRSVRWVGPDRSDTVNAQARALFGPGIYAIFPNAPTLARAMQHVAGGRLNRGGKLMKSQGLVKGWRAALLLATCCTVLTVVAHVQVAEHHYSARTKPTERCVPKHPYAGEQPECWRYLP